MILKPQDVVVVLKLVTLQGQSWSVRSLASQVFLSHSEVFEALKRLVGARLVSTEDHNPRRVPLEEFLIHGVKYAFPPERGGQTRGMPTSYAAPPLCTMLQFADDPPVWPYPTGEVRGYAFSPLYKTVPQAAFADCRLYELLALLDTIRDGRARESALAIRELKMRLEI
jgi:hypothetical protein